MVSWRFEEILVILKVCGRIFGDLRGYFSYFRDFGICGIFWLFGYFMNIMVILQIWEVVKGENFDHFENFIDILFSLEVLECLCHSKILRGFIIFWRLSYFDQFCGHKVILVNLMVYRYFYQRFQHHMIRTWFESSNPMH